jgi:hypothetical protein
MNTTVKINSVKEKNFMEKISKETASVSTEVCVITQRNTRLPFSRKKCARPWVPQLPLAHRVIPPSRVLLRCFSMRGAKARKIASFRQFFWVRRCELIGSHSNANGSHFISPLR